MLWRTAFRGFPLASYVRPYASGSGRADNPVSEGACTMRAMTEIEWLDGRVTKVPELALGDALGESVQAELDFGFDDVLEGLWVEVRHHEPDEDSDGDPRGRGCALYADCRYSLVEPSDLDRVFCILYEGQPRVQPRRGGAREPFAGLRVVLPHARISLPARRPRGPGRVRSIPLRSGFHVRPRRPRPRADLIRPHALEYRAEPKR